MDVNKARTQADWFYVDRVDQPSTTENYGVSWQTLDGSRHLTTAAAAAIPSPSQMGLMAPLDPRNCTVIPIKKIPSENSSVLLGVYPNPFKDIVTLHYTLNEPQKVQIRVFDALGQELLNEHQGLVQQGIYQTSISTQKLLPGTYIVVLNTEKESQQRIIVKIK